LGRRCVLPLCKSFEQINDRHVCCHVFRREAIKPGSEIRRRVELCVRIDFPGQITHSNRTPWDKADPQLLTSLKYAVLFHISFHERVFSLDCRHWLHRMSASDGFCTRLRETEVQSLSLLDEIFNRTSDIIDWHFWIDSVLVIEINAVGLKALQ